MAAKALTARNAPQDRQDVAFNFDSASPDKPVAVTDITATATIQDKCNLVDGSAVNPDCSISAEE